MANLGVAPPDPETDIGLLRYLIGDTEYETVTAPPEHPTWTGDYQWFSDTALSVFLSRSGQDVDKAAILAWRQMGDQLAATAADIKTDDLSVSNLWRRAQFFYDRADAAENDLNANTDIFEIAFADNCNRPAELSEWPWPCRCGGVCSCL